MFFLDNFFVFAFLGHSLTDQEKRKKKIGADWVDIMNNS